MISLKEYMNRKLKRNLTASIIAIAAVIYIGYKIEFDAVRIIRGIPSMMDLFARMLKPNLSYGGEVFEKIYETVEIAILSSLAGVAAAIPFALLTAENISPNRFLSKVLNSIFAFFRTIPSLIWAAVLVSVFSIGKFSGIIALTIIAFLMSLKLFREYIESINKNQLDSTRSVGATSIEVLRYCVLPSMLGMAISVFFIVFETNIRSATILGLVGAGGIGQIMWRDLNHLRYDNLATLILALFLTILSIDLISLWIRSYLDKRSIVFDNICKYRLYKIRKSVAIPVLFLVILSVIASSLNITMERLLIGYEQGKTIVTRMIDPDISYLPKLFKGIGESFFIALFATFTGGIFALILSYFTAFNVGPSKRLSLVLKGFVNILRTFPPIIVAIIFFRGVGPGPLAGGLALSIYTTGVLTKMYSEVLESTPKSIGESVLVTGATRFEAYRHGIFPQTFGNFISLLLYRMESNIRNSTILGIIGAGGIGTIISMNINWRNWERVGLLLLGVSIMIIIVDRISNFIRERIN